MKYLPQAFILFSLLPLSAWAANFPTDCPTAVHAKVTIDAFRTPDPSDASFSKLSGQTMEVDLVRVDQDQCVFSEQQNFLQTAGRHFLEVRDNDSTGDRTITFEGYTPESNKLYSVRVVTTSDQDLNQRFEAGLFDGSGTRELLSTGQLELKTVN